MKTLLGAATVAAIAFASPALANDFSGARAEAHLGYDVTRTKLTVIEDGDTETLKDSDSGLLYGIGIGYDFAVGENQIVGIEANLDFSNAKECAELYGDDRQCIKSKRDIEVSARFGTVVAKNLLLYAKLGYANGRNKLSYHDFDNILEDYSQSFDRAGVRVGAGLEAKVSGNLYTKAEYRYTDYKNWKEADGNDSVSLGFSRHQVLGAIGYRF